MTQTFVCVLHYLSHLKISSFRAIGFWYWHIIFSLYGRLLSEELKSDAVKIEKISGEKAEKKTHEILPP